MTQQAGKFHIVCTDTVDLTNNQAEIIPVEHQAIPVIGSPRNDETEPTELENVAVLGYN